MNLNPETACTFTIPSHFNYASRKELHKFLRKKFPRNYVGMKGATLYFNFKTSHDRDTFLSQLETMIAKRGTQTERI